MPYLIQLMSLKTSYDQYLKIEECPGFRYEVQESLADIPRLVIQEPYFKLSIEDTSAFKQEENQVLTGSIMVNERELIGLYRALEMIIRSKGHQ